MHASNIYEVHMLAEHPALPMNVLLQYQYVRFTYFNRLTSLPVRSKYGIRKTKKRKRKPRKYTHSHAQTQSTHRTHFTKEKRYFRYFIHEKYTPYTQNITYIKSIPRHFFFPSFSYFKSPLFVCLSQRYEDECMKTIIT